MKSHLLTHSANPPLNPLTGLPDINWSIYTPTTNLYWLHYLLHILLNKKKELKKPPPVVGTSSRSRSRAAEEGQQQQQEEAEDIKAYRELEALWKMLECRPKGGRRGGGGQQGNEVSGYGSGWVGLAGGAAGFVEWAVREGKVTVGEL